MWELASDYGRANVKWYTTAFVMLNPDQLQTQARPLPPRRPAPLVRIRTGDGQNRAPSPALL